MTVGANPRFSDTDSYSGQDSVKGEKYTFLEGVPGLDGTRGRYLESDLANNFVNLTDSSGIGFNATDIRRLMQVQKFLERNMRAGVRFNEFLLAHFGVAPRDEVLQRPRFWALLRHLLLLVKFFKLQSRRIIHLLES